MTRRDREAGALQARFAFGMALHQQGKLAEAERIYEEILQRAPEHFNALHLLGVIAIQTRRYERAVELIGRAIGQNANVADAHSNLGKALMNLKRPADALASYDRAIALEPGGSEPYCDRGNALRELKRPLDALASYDRSIALEPQRADAHYNRGNVLRDLKRQADALASYDRAIALKPDFALAWSNRGNTLRDLKRPSDALVSYDRTIALKPDFALAYGNRGNALRDLFRHEEALASYDRAIALKPDHAEAYSNRGNALGELERHQDALASYDRAIALRPDYAEAHWSRALTLLLTGRFEEGWREYEWRKKRDEPLAARSFPRPLWLGDESIAGKTLFIHWEQGFGDSIQFCRYARLVEARGARVVLSVQAGLRRLLEQLGPTMRILPSMETPSDFDFHCPLLSLPLALGTSLGTIPAAPRLSSDDALRAAWSSRLPPKTRPRIGVVWSGSTLHPNDHNRSLQLEQLLPLLGPDADWICLQKEIRERDVAALRQDGRIACFGEDLRDFADTAALLDLMDLVITVDTSVAHLAGAMGKPVWIMLPCNPDWRWLLNRRDSPWYPSVRLFRQPRIGDWAGVIDQVKDELLS